MSVKEAEKQKTEELIKSIEETIEKLRRHPNDNMIITDVLDPIFMLSMIEKMFDLNISIVEALKAIKEGKNPDAFIEKAIQDVRPTLNSYYVFKNDALGRMLNNIENLKTGAGGI